MKSLLFISVSFFLLNSCTQGFQNQVNVSDTLKTYYPNGSIKSISVYKDGKMNGMTANYFGNGSLKNIAIYINDHLVDSAIFYHSNGNINYVSYYDSLGNSLGIPRIWYDNGKLRQEVIPPSDTSTFEVSRLYYRNGNLFAVRKYRNKKRDGTWQYFTEDGKAYKEELYEYGNLRVDPEMVVVVTNSGDSIIQTGYRTTYYDIIPKSIHTETYFVNSIRNGYAIEYYQSQTVKAIEQFKDDKLDGKQVYFQPGGWIEKIAYYESGKPIGKWLYFNEEEKVIRTEQH